MLPHASFGISSGIVIGGRRCCGLCEYLIQHSSFTSKPPIPTPIKIAASLMTSLFASIDASSSAIFAAATAYCEKRAILRAASGFIYLVASKFFTSPAYRALNVLASKCVMRATPLVPAFAAAHVSATEFPIGVTAPIPVITTRLFSITANSCLFRYKITNQ